MLIEIGKEELIRLITGLPIPGDGLGPFARGHKQSEFAGDWNVATLRGMTNANLRHLYKLASSLPGDA